MSVDDAGLSPEERELLAHLLGRSDEGEGPIRPRAAGTPAPLSFSQRRLWVAEQLRPGDPAYHLWVAFRASGPLDRAALAASLASIVARHALLRSTVEVIEGEPYWREHRPAPVALPVTSLVDGPAADRDARVREATRAETLQPFDLTDGPLLRARLLHVDHDEHVLVLVMHHLVTDGWSMGVLFRELAALYEAHRHGRPSPLPPLTLQYADVAAWQHTHLGGSALAAKIAGWRRDLDGAQAAGLEGDRPRAADPGSAGAEELARLGPEVVTTLERLAREEGATRFMTLLAAFSVLLSRYAATRDVLVGIASAGRDRAELEPLIGLFVNLLPFRTRVESGATFRTLLREVRARALDAFDRQEVPFDRLVDELGAARTLDRHPLFQVVFTAQDALLRPLELADLVLTPLELPATSTRFDLEAHVLDARDGVRLGFVYSTARFDAATIRRALDHYVALVERCAAQPDVPLASLAWVGDAERAALDGMARGAEPGAADTPLVPTLLRAAVATRPEADAVIGEGARLSYRQLDERAARLASWLRLRGVRRGHRVGVLMDRTVDFVVALCAALEAGAAYVPLDPSYPDERIGYMAADSGMTVLLTSGLMRPPSLPAHVQVLDVAAARTELDALPRSHRPFDLDADDLAYVVYTSGSTGTPKGVEVPHGALANLVRWHLRAFDVGPADCATQIASVGFDACVWEVWPYLAAGARLCLAGEEARTNPERLWQWLRDEGVTIAFVPTPLAEAALRDGPPAGLRLRALLTGGDRLTLQPSAGWPFALVNNYGPTENAVVSTSGIVTADPSGRPPSIGGPVDRVQTYVLDADLQPVPVGIVGELHVGGASLARGYLGRAAQTAAAFVPDPFSGHPGARLYKTGDLVRWRPDGTLDFIGRRDGQVKVRGHRIELGEVEAALARVPGVATAVATLHGTGAQRRIVGYVVGAPGATLAGDDVRAAVRPWLPAYMVPSAVLCLEALPVSAHGKVDRAALPEPTFDESGTAAAGPRTPTEALLERIWREVLGLTRVGVHDNFFDVGGDSILSIQIASRATQAGLRLSPRLFFEHQTIADLAAAVEAAAGAPDAQAGPAAGEDEAGPCALTPIQCWFFDQHLASPDHFNQAVLLDLRMPCDDQALRTAIAALVQRHAVLRSRFSPGSAVAARIEPPHDQVPLVVLDLRAAAAGGESDAITAACADAQTSLSLGDGPLFRAVVMRLGGERTDRLFLVAHHLVVDGVSWRILLDDLHTALQAARQSLPVRLAPVSTSWRTWTATLTRQAAAAAPSAVTAWERQLDDFAPLPLDHRSGDADAWCERTAAHVRSRIGVDDTDALLRVVSATTGFRLHEVLVAGVVQALASWTGRSVVHLDVESHGRETIGTHVDLSRTVGWFTSVYPVRFASRPGTAPLDAVAHAAAALRAVPDGGVEFGILRYLAADPALRARVSRACPDVSVNYLGQFDAASDGRLLAPAKEAIGPQIAPGNRRAHALEVNARVQAGCLEIDWTYGRLLHDESTIRALSGAVEHFLRAVVRASHAAAGKCSASHGADSGDALSLQVVRDRYGRVEIEDAYALGPLQRGMVAGALAHPGQGRFVSQFELVLDRRPDPEVLREAWAALHARHPVLRTVFVDAEGGDFRQVVLKEVPLAWAAHDWSHEPAAKADASFEVLRHDDRLRGFAPGEVPSRVTFVQLRPGRAHVLWTHHHALLDGWSVAMLLDELFALHAALTAGSPLTAEPRPPYRRYADWLSRQDASADEAFWRAHLADVVAPTTLVSDRGPASPSSQGATLAEVDWWMDESATESVVAGATRLRVTLNTLVQGAWALLLSRHSGEHRVVYGTAVSGRPEDLDGVERMVGLFLNGVPLAVEVPDDAVVRDWLVALQRRHADVRQHQHVALADIQRWTGTGIPRPLFEISMAFENYPVAPTLSAAAAQMGVAEFRLTSDTGAALHLRVVPGRRLRFMLAYDAGRLESGMAYALVAQLDAIVRLMVADPAATLGTLSLAGIPGTEAAAPIADAPSVAEAPAPAGVHIGIVAAAAGDPARVAIEAPDVTMTYGEFARRTAAVAAALQAQALARGDVVGVYLPRSADLVVALVGILRAGGAFVILDPAYPSARTAEQLAAAGVQRVICTRAETTALAAWCAAGPSRSLLPLAAIAAEAGGGHAPSVDVLPDDVAYLAFTSGSTGQPKAVIGRHGALAAYGPWLADTFGVGLGDRVSMLTALSHDPLLRDVFPTLQLGATLTIPPADAFDRAGALAAWAETAGVTVMNLTPSMAQLLLEGAENPLPALRLALFVGEPLTRPLVDRFRALAPAATVVNLYGATESQQSLGYHVVPDRPAPDERAVLPAGRGMPGVVLRVMRGDLPAGVGEVGEIWIESARLAAGYSNDRALTAARFAPRPPGDRRAYRTGDRGWLAPSDDVHVLGRADSQMKVRGFRVEAGELEARLLQCPGVREAAAVVTGGPGDGGVLLAVVTGTAEPAEVLARLRDELPAHLVPGRLVRVAAMPRTASGKVDRRRLASLAPPDAADTTAAPPRTPIEMELAALWTELLRLPRVGVDDSFFELGGHSIVAARLAARVRERFAVDLQIPDVFRRPRLADQAALIAERQQERDGTVGALIDELAGLSDDELRALLGDAGIAGGDTPR